MYQKIDDDEELKHLLNKKEFLQLAPQKLKSYFNKHDLKYLKKKYEEYSDQIQFYDYQIFAKRFVNLFSLNKRLLVKYGTGTGKTLLSLGVASKFIEEGGTRVNIIGLTKDIFLSYLLTFKDFGYVNKELIEEMKNSDIIKKRVKKKIFRTYKFFGFQKFVNELFSFKTIIDVLSLEDIYNMIESDMIRVNQNMVEDFRGSILIVDECHNLYNSIEINNYGVSLLYLLNELKDDIYMLFLSATPINNHPSEIVDLIGLLNYNFHEPREKFFDGINLKNGALKEMSKYIFGKVAYLETRDKELYPEQVFVGDDYGPLKMISTSDKMKTLLKYVKTNGKIIIYHNRVSQGIEKIGNFLAHNGFIEYGQSPTKDTLCLICGLPREDKHDHEFVARKYVLFHGGLKNKQEILDRYNSYENRNGHVTQILIGSEVIEESIDFNCILHMFIMSPPINIGKLRQLLGRAVRSKSHQWIETKIVKTYLIVTDEDILRYEDMMEKFDVIKNINYMLDNYAIDKFINYDIISTEGDPLADYPIKPFKFNPKIDTKTFELFYDEVEREEITNAIRSVFDLVPVWTYDDLFLEVKNLPYIHHFIDEDNFKLALADVREFNIVQRGKYFVKTYQLDHYNFLSSITPKTIKSFDIGSIDVKETYESMRREYIKYIKDKSILNMTFANFDENFHISFCREAIQYIYNLVHGGKPTEDHHVFLKTLYFYDRFGLIIYAAAVDLDYGFKVQNPTENFKFLLFDSLSNVTSLHPTFSKFDDALKHKSFNPDTFPVGHFLGTIPEVYHDGIWVDYKYKITKNVKPENNIVVGFLRKTRMKFTFKLKIPKKIERDKRKKTKGIKCHIVPKKKLIDIGQKLGLDASNNVSSLCEEIRKVLIKNELQNKDGLKWFYFHFEKFKI